MKAWKYLGLFAICFPLCACQGEEISDSASDEMLFQEDPQRLAGERIELRGFLDIRLGSLALYRDQSSAARARFDDQPVVIRDTSPEKRLRLESRYLERTCTGTYVKLLGVVGHLEEHNFYGISDIVEIRVFADERFLGEGKICYSSTDSTIYMPREIDDES